MVQAEKLGEWPEGGELADRGSEIWIVPKVDGN